MKTPLKMVLNTKVHSSWFVLTCLLLGAVVLVAALMARDLSSVTDKVLQQSQTPAVFHPHV